MLKVYRLPLLLFACSCFSVQAQTMRDFDRVDTDGNGLLSIEEARRAFPDLNIVDSNGDGFCNHVEVERVLPGIQFPGEGSGVHTVIGVSDYQIIARVISGEDGGERG